MPLVERRQGKRAYFAASGRDVEPPEWYGPAPPFQKHMPPSARQRRTYYAILAAELWWQKHLELSEGLDARGNPLIPVKLPRKGRSDWHRMLYRRGHGPPLTPFLTASRARNLLRYRSNEREAVVYWAAKRAPGAKYTWAEILVFHANGLVPGAPARNVIGISPDGLRVSVERAIKRYRIGSGPRKAELPTTTRWDATARERRKPEAGGDPFDIRFEKPRVLERAGRAVMRLFRKPAPPPAPKTKPIAPLPRPRLAPPSLPPAPRPGPRYDPTKVDVKTPFRPAKTMDEALEYSRNLGFELEGAPDLTTANRINQSVHHDIARAGPLTQYAGDRIIIRQEAGRAGGISMGGTRQIVLHAPDTSSWEAIDATFKRGLARDPSWTSSGDAADTLHCLYHELGHTRTLQYEAAARELGRLILSGRVDLAKISRYAASYKTNSSLLVKEAWAEVYAATRKGDARKLPPEVLDLVRRYLP